MSPVTRATATAHQEQEVADSCSWRRRAPCPPSSQSRTLCGPSGTVLYDIVLYCTVLYRSVSMMLESTLHAVHSSFHAVLGVAEHLTKMKLQVSQVSNTPTITKFH